LLARIDFVVESQSFEKAFNRNEKNLSSRRHLEGKATVAQLSDHST
jgi:hypothetical protein